MQKRHNRIKHLRGYLFVKMAVLLEVKMQALLALKDVLEEFRNFLLLSLPVFVVHVSTLLFHVESLHLLCAAGNTCLFAI